MKSIKEIADITEVSKTTVVRYIKNIGATEAVRNGQTFLYDDAVVALIIKEIHKKDTATTTTKNISVNKDDNNLKRFEKTLQILENELKEKNEQIESLQTILNQQQQLLLYEQQKNTKLLEDNIENKRWWQWWK